MIILLYLHLEEWVIQKKNMFLIVLELFPTIAYENMDKYNCSSEGIEGILSHKDTNKIKKAYNRTTNKKRMKTLMTWYEMYLISIQIH